MSPNKFNAFLFFLLHQLKATSQSTTNGFFDVALLRYSLLSTKTTFREKRESKEPTNPFPDGLSYDIQKAMDEYPKLFEDTISEEATTPEYVLDNTQLLRTCTDFSPLVQAKCVPGNTKDNLVPYCHQYFRDCSQYLAATDPLYAIANSFNSRVGLNFGSFGINGIPYYPVNEEGAVEISNLASVPFGSWGGGYTSNLGVRDFWSQITEIGGNWYEGKYGVRSGWVIPLLQSIGIESNSGVGVSVPIKKGDLGKPVAVDIGGGLGPYYQQNNHVAIDWLNGGVQQNLGIGIPLIGVGINSGWGLQFPSIGSLA